MSDLTNLKNITLNGVPLAAVVQAVETLQKRNEYQKSAADVNRAVSHSRSIISRGIRNISRGRTSKGRVIMQNGVLVNG